MSDINKPFKSKYKNVDKAEEKSGKISLFLEKFVRTGVHLLIFLMPLFFLPWTVDQFGFSKYILLIVLTSFLMVVWSVKVLISKKSKVHFTAFDIPIVALLIALIISSIFSQNKILSVYGRTSTVHWTLVESVALFLFYLLVKFNFERENIPKLLKLFLLSTFLTGVVYLLTFFNLVLNDYTGGFPLNLTGFPVNISILTGLGLIFAVGIFFKSTTNKKVTKHRRELPLLLMIPFCLVALAVFLASNPLTARSVSDLTGKAFIPYIGLDFKTSWNISIDTFQQYPLFGSGLSTFLIFFNLYRPVAFNSSEYWNLRFQKPFNEYLLLLSETGLLGVLSFLSLAVLSVIALIKVLRSKKADNLDKIILFGLLLMFVTFAFTYITIFSAFLFIFILALASVVLRDLNIMTRGKVLNLEIQKNPVFLRSFKLAGGSVLLILSLGFAILVGVLSTKFLRAEIYYKRALVAISDNKAQEAYSNLSYAIALRPNNDQYRNANSRLLMLVATNSSKQEELTEKEQKNVYTMVSESLQELRRTTEIITPQDAANWQLRAQTYSSLIGSVENAEQFAVESYKRALNLDPNNPVLRLEVGNLYFGLGLFDQAALQFERAVLLKPDYINAYYNLGLTYKEMEKYNEAKVIMEELIEVLPENSVDSEKSSNIEDREIVEKQLEDINKLIKQSEANADNETNEEIERDVETDEEEE